MITEEVAKTKWCPMTNFRGNYCIASACMAWRWGERGIDYVETDSEDKGFCGLAGRILR